MTFHSYMKNAFLNKFQSFIPIDKRFLVIREQCVSSIDNVFPPLDCVSHLMKPGMNPYCTSQNF